MNLKMKQNQWIQLRQAQPCNLSPQETLRITMAQAQLRTHQEVYLRRETSQEKP
jgi:hypothetical protein